MNQAWAQNQNATMQAQAQRMVWEILNNPQAMAGYQRGICGPGLTPEQYAYKYGATRGCTREGYEAYNRTSNEIARNEQASRDSYYRSMQTYRDAYGNWVAGNAANQREFGRVLGGSQTYYDQTTGRTVPLGYLQPGQQHYDPQTNRTYSMAPNGQYYSTDANGWSTPISPMPFAPR
jgi:hypothetical protein